MKKFELGQVINTLANLGVIAGIAFLAVELRQNSDAVQSQTRSQISIAYAELLQTQRQDERLLEAGIKRSRGEPLEPIDLAKIRLNVFAHLRLGENTFFQLREGNYSEDEFDGERNWWKNYLSQPVNREIWESAKFDFSPAFRQELDALVDDR
jgi:predicted glycosyltransferase involved in capsule biosynthesis